MRWFGLRRWTRSGQNFSEINCRRARRFAWRYLKSHWWSDERSKCVTMTEYQNNVWLVKNNRFCVEFFYNREYCSINNWVLLTNPPSRQISKLVSSSLTRLRVDLTRAQISALGKLLQTVDSLVLNRFPKPYLIQNSDTVTYNLMIKSACIWI